nr:MAG TPA: hypothetical protein [Caudoviricetes sp.]
MRILLGRQKCAKEKCVFPWYKRGLYVPVFNRRTPPSLVTAL